MTNYNADDIFVFKPKAQTLKAWEPFWDYVDILFQFQTSDIHDGDEELSEWRLFWIAGIALLRSIGHVLAKVDTRKSERHSEIVNNFWNQIRSNRSKYKIFWNFIDDERNSILKTYSSGAQLVIDGRGARVEFSDGSDAFELFRQAVYWWRGCLIGIESELAAIDSTRATCSS